MKTIAVIIAGGSGHRMGQDIPKQFINVYDKPIIIYTLEGFQRHPMVDEIEVGFRNGAQDAVPVPRQPVVAMRPGPVAGLVAFRSLADGVPEEPDIVRLDFVQFPFHCLGGNHVAVKIR